MLKVVSTKYVHNESLEDFLKVAQEMIDNTIKESGCISYSMFKETKEENRYAFLEEWENDNFLKAHLETDFMKTHILKLNSLCYKKGDLMIFEEIR